MQVHEIKRRYEVGLEKLLGAETQVGQMKKELEELQPVLIKTQKETDELLIVVERDSKAADEKRQVEHHSILVCDLHKDESFFSSENIVLL